MAGRWCSWLHIFLLQPGEGDGSVVVVVVVVVVVGL